MALGRCLIQGVTLVEAIGHLEHSPQIIRHTLVTLGFINNTLFDLVDSWSPLGRTSLNDVDPGSVRMSCDITLHSNVHFLLPLVAP